MNTRKMHRARPNSVQNLASTHALVVGADWASIHEIKGLLSVEGYTVTVSPVFRSAEKTRDRVGYQLRHAHVDLLVIDTSGSDQRMPHWSSLAADARRHARPAIVLMDTLRAGLVDRGEATAILPRSDAELILGEAARTLAPVIVDTALPI